MLVPINRLPVELLVAIFKDVVSSLASPPALESLPGVYFSSKHMLMLMHVCSMWRDVTVSYAPFWSHVDLENSPQSVETSLKRSSSSPLAFHLALDKPNLGQKLEFLRENSAWARALYVKCGRIDSDSPLIGVLEQSYYTPPRIECLAVVLKRNVEV